MSEITFYRTGMDTAQAVNVAARLIEEAFPSMVEFTTEREKIWVGSLSEFAPDVICEAAARCIQECKFPPAVADMREKSKAVERERGQAAMVETLRSAPETLCLPAGDDPFVDAGGDVYSRAFGVGDKPVDVNRKLLRVQLAWLHDQKAKGIDAPKKIPFNSPEHRILKERISEFDGVPVYQLADKVRQVLGCE